MADEANPKKDPTSGCLIRGCLVIGFLVVVLGGMFGWSVYSTYKHLESVMSDGPRTLPEFTYDPARYEHLEKEIAEFVQAAQAGKPDDMRLTAADLNTVFAHARELGGFSANAYFKIIENRLYLDTSIPLTAVSGFEDRWFNGEIVVGLLIEQERLQIEPVRIASGDKEVPLSVLDAMKKIDWTSYLSEELRNQLGFVRSVSIEDNELILRTDTGAKEPHTGESTR